MENKINNIKSSDWLERWWDLGVPHLTKLENKVADQQKEIVALNAKIEFIADLIVKLQQR